LGKGEHSSSTGDDHRFVKTKGGRRDQGEERRNREKEPIWENLRNKTSEGRIDDHA